MAVPLTADLCARAVIAAARVLGEDPVLALTGPKIKGAGSVRRCLCPAALAIVGATGLARQTVCRIIGADKFGLAQAARDRPEAVAAARAAIMSPQVGTVVAPPPVGQDAPAPATAPAKIDHTAAIAEAMARRRAKGCGPVEVVGVEDDKALIGATEPGGCVWPMGDPRAPDYRSCQAARLSGRMYCAEHLKKAGLKPVAKVIQTVGRVAESYVDREAS